MNELGTNGHGTNGHGGNGTAVLEESQLELRGTQENDGGPAGVAVRQEKHEALLERVRAAGKGPKGKHPVRLETLGDARRLMARATKEMHEGSISVRLGRAMIYAARSFMRAALAEEEMKRKPAVDLSMKDMAKVERERRKGVQEEFERLQKIGGLIDRKSTR